MGQGLRNKPSLIAPSIRLDIQHLLSILRINRQMAPATVLEDNLIELSKMLFQLLTYCQGRAPGGRCEISCPTLQMGAVFDSTNGTVYGRASIGAMEQYSFIAQYSADYFQLECQCFEVKYDGVRWGIYQSETGSSVGETKLFKTEMRG